MKKYMYDIILLIIVISISAAIIPVVGEYETRFLENGIFDFLPKNGDASWFDTFYFWNTMGSYFSLVMVVLWCLPRLNVRHNVERILRQPFWWRILLLISIGLGACISIFGATVFFELIPDKGGWLLLPILLFNPGLIFYVSTFIASPAPVKYVPYLTKKIRRW
jgi:hypothetical protein